VVNHTYNSTPPESLQQYQNFFLRDSISSGWNRSGAL